MRRTLLQFLFVLTLVVNACAPAQPAGIVRDPAPEVGGLSLPDAAGIEQAFVGPPDGYLLVYFGFTSCPDICPTTMADLRQALSDIGDDAEHFEVAMVTVDPDRDGYPEVQRYVDTFFGDGLALRTDDDSRLREVATGFGADYDVTTVDGQPEVGHTAYLYAVNEAGEMLLQWPFGVTADDIANDLEILLDRL
ncbi:MAG: SCO family protein [Acidimicrobiia bacterium]|nr:MAG: SCO family protein [Acidimicrobiia bacterium]